MEAAGEVLEVGSGVAHVRPGERVVYACPPLGAYCETRTLPAGQVIPLPEDIDDETAAAGFLKGLTAEFLLHRVHRLREGETVLVHAAAGGVGSLLCQWARHLGATVIGAVGSEDKAALARRNGCSAVIVHGREDFVERVRALTDGHGVDAVYDAVGRDTFDRSVEALAIRGHLVSYGQASGRIEPIDIATYDSKSLTVSRPNYGHYALDPRQLPAAAERLFDAIRRGIIEISVGQHFPLREAAAAHRALEARETTGSTLLIP
jgi:NADPH:quinone reductase-like Zn-dependent oxidoreductase